MKYLFTTSRLGFRTWKDSDLDTMSEINADPEVMRYFPSIQDKNHTADFILRMQKEFEIRNYCYFAIEILDTQEFIGFTGLHLQEFESDFTPCTDIGWRLKKSAWNKGYATEAALKCLQYGEEVVGLKEIYAITPAVNIPSENVMKKAGLKYIKNFDFTVLKDSPHLLNCVLYKWTKNLN